MEPDRSRELFLAAASALAERGAAGRLGERALAAADALLWARLPRALRGTEKPFPEVPPELMTAPVRRALALFPDPDASFEWADARPRMMARALSPEGRGLRVTSSRRRHARGAFYTPPEIVGRILDASLRPGTRTLLDPACGAGAFLVGAAARAPDAALFGVDLDAGAVAWCRARLRAAGPEGPSAPGFRLAAGDALIGALPDDPPAVMQIARACAAEARVRPLDWSDAFPEAARGFDAVVGNPPFEVMLGKSAHGAAARPARMAYRRFARACYRLQRGEVNLFRMFLERAWRLTAPGGRMALLVPTSVLGDKASVAIRENVLAEGRDIAVTRFPERARLFGSVCQDLVILAATRAEESGPRRAPRDAVSVSIGGGAPAAPAQVMLPRAVIERCGGRVPLVRSEQEAALLARVLEIPTLVDLAREGRAPFRPREGEVHLTRFRACLRSHPSNGAAPLLRGAAIEPFALNPHAAGGRADRIDADAFSALNSSASRRAAAARPEPFDRSTGSRPRAESRGRLTAPSKVEGQGRGAAPWQRPRTAYRQVANIALARRLVAAPVPEGVFLANTAGYLEGREAADDLWLALLGSALFEWRYRATSATNHVLVGELSALPFGAPLGPAADALRRAARRARRDRRALPRAVRDIDAAVARAFGLSARDRALVAPFSAYRQAH